MQALYRADPSMVVWWATEIECTSAIARRQRLGQLREAVVTEALTRSSALGTAWHEASPASAYARWPSRCCDGHQYGGAQPTDISMIDRREYGLRLLRWLESL